VPLPLSVNSSCSVFEMPAKAFSCVPQTLFVHALYHGGFLHEQSDLGDSTKHRQWTMITCPSGCIFHVMYNERTDKNVP